MFPNACLFFIIRTVHLCARIQILMSVLKEQMNAMNIATTQSAVILVTAHQLGLDINFIAMAPLVKVNRLSLVPGPIPSLSMLCSLKSWE